MLASTLEGRPKLTAETLQIDGQLLPHESAEVRLRAQLESYTFIRPGVCRLGLSQNFVCGLVAMVRFVRLRIKKKKSKK